MTLQTQATIDAEGLDHRALNERVRELLAQRAPRVVIENVCGQRYIGAGLAAPAEIEIEGVPGNDLACFSNGARIVVRGNAQDGVANTMSAGEVVVHGHTGDVAAYAMRGGRLFVRGDAGYRVGIHMKAFREKVPAVVVGGRAGDYLGEYMAGGTLVVLGLDKPRGWPRAGRLVGTGMHGGEILIRGRLEDHQLGSEVGRVEVTEESWSRLERELAAFCREFGLEARRFSPGEFTRLVPVSSRPYGRLYVY